MDTGAQVSVVPASNLKLRSGLSGIALRAANRSLIRTYGSRTASVQINSRIYKWTFIIADVKNRFSARIFYVISG